MSQGLTYPEKRKRVREGVAILLSIILIVFLTHTEIRLTQISADVPMESNIAIFGVINVVILLVILLVYLVCRNVVKLFMENRSNPFAKSLRTRLAISFVGLSLVPTMLLFFAAAAFINNTVHNWFNTQVETSLSESLEVAQTYYRSYASNALYYARQISGFIRERKLVNQENLTQLRELIAQKQKEYNLGVVEVYSAQMEELVRVSNPAVPKAEFLDPDSEDIERGLAGNELTRVNQAGKADLIRGIVPVYSTYNRSDIVAIVVVNYHVPYSLVSKMKEITNSYHEFRQLKILKNPIRAGYIITLFLIATVIIFLAYWMGIYLSNSITKPLHELVDATRSVSEGNLDVHIRVDSPDEIGMLVKSFNLMAEDLKAKQEALNSSNRELSLKNEEIEQRRRYMETVLENVAAGVISVDRYGTVSTVNKSAERLLHLNAASAIGKNFRDTLGESHLNMLKETLRSLVQTRQDRVDSQILLDIKGERLALHIHLTILRDEAGSFIGTVLVLDDLTQVMKAQRMAAWREVARRIAHEIKNPLTPIQLSAERLRKRYLSRFGDDEKVFDECTSMIVKSVEEIKNLVNEFSNFARMPAIQPMQNDLNLIIREALALYQEAHRNVVFIFRPDDALPQIMIDRGQIRRVIINLLENAVAAMEEKGEIIISTDYDPALRLASFSVADNGPGISPGDRPHLFEPYFSTRKSGTGLGLAIVNSIISDHNGFVRVRDNSPHGACFVIELPAV